MPDPEPRDVWWVEIEGVEEGKVRICVVVRIESDRAQVVYGQGSPRAGVEHIEVIPGTPSGKRFRVTKPTYFRETNVCFVHKRRFKKKLAVCPHDAYLKLGEFAGRMNRRAPGS